MPSEKVHFTTRGTGAKLRASGFAQALRRDGLKVRVVRALRGYKVVSRR